MRECKKYNSFDHCLVETKNNSLTIELYALAKFNVLKTSDILL